MEAGLARTKAEGSELKKRMDLVAHAGAELFSIRGFLETSMEDVAAAAKLSKGGLYHYFAGKTDILFYILSGFLDLVLEDLEEELHNIEGSIGKIRFLVFRHVEIYTKHFYAARTQLHEAHNLPSKHLKKVTEKERRYYQVITEVLSEYLGAGVKKDLVTAVTFTLLGMCNWIYSWYDPKGPIKPEQLSGIIFDIFSSGVSGLRRKSAMVDEKGRFSTRGR
jgi:AcrR family transcriptional regulator